MPDGCRTDGADIGSLLRRCADDPAKARDWVSQHSR